MCFYAQAIFKVPFSNTFPTLKKIDFQINLVLDVPEGANPPRLTESFREFRAFVSLGNIFSNCKLFDTPCIHPDTP